MEQKTDQELLCQYQRNHSEDAFAALVHRHINLVHSTAVRIVRDRHTADDVTQAVFLILFKKARSLSQNIVLTGWLYRTARFAAVDVLKSKYRRERREREGLMIEPASDPDLRWKEAMPLLDPAMARLRDNDRNAILLRYFQNKSLKEVGVALGVSDDTAQKRITRGLEKLRRLFSRGGVAVTAGTVASLISTQAVHAAPLGSAEAICAMAVNGTNLSLTTTIIMKGTLKMLAWIQFRTAAILACALLVVATGVTVLGQRTEPKAPADSERAPVEALRTLANALKTYDTNAFTRAVHAQTAIGSAFVSTTRDLVAAQARFKHALAEKFSEPNAVTAMATVNLTAFQFGQNNLDSAEVTVEGDQATVRIPSRSNPGRTRSHKMVKKNGVWQLDADSKIGTVSERELAIFKTVRNAIEGTIAEVRAGKYKTIEEAVAALKSQVTAAAMAQN